MLWKRHEGPCAHEGESHLEEMNRVSTAGDYGEETFV